MAEVMKWIKEVCHFYRLRFYSVSLCYLIQV